MTQKANGYESREARHEAADDCLAEAVQSINEGAELLAEARADDS